MASAVGSVEIDFGSFPGSNEASVAVTGQSLVTSSAKVDAYIMADSTTSNHTASDHKYSKVFIDLTCGTPTDSVGFTIYARSEHKLTGKFLIQWVWVV